MTINENLKNLIRLLKKQKVDEDSCVGIILELKHHGGDYEAKAKFLYEWIVDNPDADQSLIFDKLDEMLN